MKKKINKKSVFNGYLSNDLSSAKYSLGTHKHNVSYPYGWLAVSLLSEFILLCLL